MFSWSDSTDWVPGEFSIRTWCFQLEKETKPEQENRREEFDTEVESACSEVNRTRRCMQVVHFFDRGLLERTGRCEDRGWRKDIPFEAAVWAIPLRVGEFVSFVVPVSDRIDREAHCRNFNGTSAVICPNIFGMTIHTGDRQTNLPHRSITSLPSETYT